MPPGYPAEGHCPCRTSPSWFCTVLLIADDERPLAHRRLRRAFRVTDATARADARALVLRLKVRLVVDIAEAQSTCVQTG
ncbi:hypothetical protein P9477_03050 [Enterobacter mori]